MTQHATPALHTTALLALPPKCPQTGQLHCHSCHNPAHRSTAAVSHGTAQPRSRLTSLLSVPHILQPSAMLKGSLTKVWVWVPALLTHLHMNES